MPIGTMMQFWWRTRDDNEGGECDCAEVVRRKRDEPFTCVRCQTGGARSSRRWLF